MPLPEMTLYIAREGSKVASPSFFFLSPNSLSFLHFFLIIYVSLAAISVCSQLWRKISIETSVELQLLLEKWKLVLAGLVFQVLLRAVFRGYSQVMIKIFFFFFEKK